MSEQSSDERPSIASAIITHNGKVLLVRRRVKERSLSWQFPGGQIEQGESPGDAAVREVREETGLVVAASELIGDRIHPNTGRSMIYVACGVVRGEAQVVDDEELDALTWAGLGEISDYIPYGLYEPVQRHLDKTLSA
ncbi:MAG TPA: NUDIX hydrolase [Pseudonocardiaceae bacterium]|nr:NUDIX hydrolase [Pseudonocardiaceae bacterium]